MGMKGLGARPQALPHASHSLPDFPGGTSESPGELVKRKAESRPGVADSAGLEWGVGMGISNQFPGAADADRLWAPLENHCRTFPVKYDRRFGPQLRDAP